MECPNLFEYSDYRLFVKDMIEYLKVTSEGFSFRKFAKSAGLASPGLIYLIIQNKTAASDKTAQKLAKGFGLSKTEAKFFSELVQFNQAKNDEDRRFHYEQMLGQKQYQRCHPLAKEEYAYYSRWYYPVIRELVGLREFRAESSWISERLLDKIKASEAAEALKDLTALGMIVWTAGRFEQAQASITTGDEITAVNAISLFHEAMMKRAAEAQVEMDSAWRDISSLTLTMDQTKFSEIKSEVIQFRKQLFKKYGEVNLSHDLVVQMNLQLFPLTRFKKS